MYVAIVHHKPKRGHLQDRILYSMELSAYEGGTAWARSADYQTIQAVERTAGDLFMQTLNWIAHEPGGRILYHAHVDCEPHPVLPETGREVPRDAL